MALDDSTIGLLMQISADPAKAQAALESLRVNTESVTQAMAGNFASLSSGIESSLVSVLGPAGIAIAGMGAIGAGLLELGEKTANYGEELVRASEKTGIATDKLGGLSYAAKLTGGNFDSVTKGLAIMSRGLSDLAGPGAMTVKALQQVGVQAKDSSGHVRPLYDVLLDLADRFSKMPDGAEKAAASMAIFGRAGADLIPTLNLGREGIEKLQKQAEQFGLALTPEAAERAEQFKIEVEMLHAQMDGLSMTIGQNAIPALSVLMGMFEGNDQAAEIWSKNLAAIVIGIVDLPFLALSKIPLLGQYFEPTVKALGNEIHQLETDTLLASQKMTDGFKFLKGAMKEPLDPLAKLTKAGKEYTDELEKQLQADKEVAEGLESGELPARQKIITEINREIAARSREINSYRALAAAGKLNLDELATREQEYTADVATLARERDDKIRASDAAITERLKAQLLPAVEGVDKAYQDYFKTIGEIVQVSSGADRAFLTNLANAKLLDDTMKTLTADSDALAKSMAATFEKSGGMPAQLGAAAAAFSPLAGAIKLTEDHLEQLFSQSTIDINQWAADQGISTQQVQQDYIRMVLGMKTQLGISKTDLYNWQQDMQTDFSLVRTATTVFAGMATQDLQKFSSALGQSAANAIVSGTNIARAVEQAVKSTLTSIAGEAAVRALYNTGLGFYYLAIQDYADAALAFDAAAVFGTIAGVAGGVAAALPGGGAGTGAGASAGGRGGFGSGVSEISATGLTRAQQQSFLAPGSSGALGPPPGPQVVNVNIHAEGMVVTDSYQFADVVTQAVTRGVEQHGMRAVSSHSVYGASVSKGRQ